MCAFWQEYYKNNAKFPWILSGAYAFDLVMLHLTLHLNKVVSAAIFMSVKATFPTYL